MDGEEKQALRFFNLESIEEPLRGVARIFADAARKLIFETHDSEMRDQALYRLLEARDYAVRAKQLQAEGATAKD